MPSGCWDCRWSIGGAASDNRDSTTRYALDMWAERVGMPTATIPETFAVTRSAYTDHAVAAMLERPVSYLRRCPA